jgi:rhomboid protease GluP
VDTAIVAQPLAVRGGLAGAHWSLRATQQALSHTARGLSATPATTALVLWLILVWVVEALAVGPMHTSSAGELLAFGALPNARVGNSAGPGDWWRYIASTFLHDSAHPWQLLWNVAILAAVGSLVEKVHGSLVLVASLLITGVAAGLFWVASASLGVTGAPEFAIGASGGICGVGGVLLAVGVGRRGGMTGELRRRVVMQAVPVVLATALAGLVISNINNIAHVGGLIVGGLLGLLLPARTAVGGRGLALAERVVLSAIVAVAMIAVAIAGVHVGGVL